MLHVFGALKLIKQIKTITQIFYIKAAQILYFIEFIIQQRYKLLSFFLSFLQHYYSVFWRTQNHVVADQGKTVFIKWTNSYIKYNLQQLSQKEWSKSQMLVVINLLLQAQLVLLDYYIT